MYEVWTVNDAIGGNQAWFRRGQYDNAADAFARANSETFNKRSFLRAIVRDAHGVTVYEARGTK